MGLWAEATIHVEQPKIYNIKDKLTEAIKRKFGDLDEFIVDSTYSNDDGLIIGIRTGLTGVLFDEIIQFCYKKLKHLNVGHFYIKTLSNWYI